MIVGIDKFKVGDVVFGTSYDHRTEQETSYFGVVERDFEDDSYIVSLRNGKDVFVELYDKDTMQHATKLHKLLAGLNDEV